MQTWSTMDNCRNTETCNQIIAVEDTTPPSINTDASGLMVDGSGNTNELNSWRATNGGASSSDVCGMVSWSDDNSGLTNECGVTGTTMVTFTVKDDCGNSATTSATLLHDQGHHGSQHQHGGIGPDGGVRWLQQHHAIGQLAE